MSFRKGFTLMELLIVVLIVGILSSVATPQYLKTVDSSRITDGFGMMMLIGSAQKMCWMDHPTSRSVCIAENYYGNNATMPYLVRARYISQSSWPKSTDKRKVFYATAAYGASSCSVKGVRMSQTNTVACMLYPTPNSWGADIGYVDQDNVCKKMLPNATHAASPSCP